MNELVNEIDEKVKKILDQKILELENDTETLPVIIETKDVVSDIENITNDINYDYDTIRKSMHNQLQFFDQASRQALTNLLSCDHPRMVEVFAKLMDSQTNLSEKLLKMQKDMKDLTGIRSNLNANINAQNVFIGTSADLLNEEGGAQDVADHARENIIDAEAIKD